MTTPLGRVLIESHPVADLKAWAGNPRSITEGALAGLGASVARFGLVQPIVWNRRTGNVVGGHQRLRALVAQGVTVTDVAVVDLEPVDEKALNVVLNSEAISGSWTKDALALIDEIAALLPAESASLLLPDQRDLIEGLLPRDRRAVADDDVPPPPVTPISKSGDVWLLGAHRLACGDAENALDVARCLGGHVPGLMVTDPPYGVAYDPNWRAPLNEFTNLKSTGTVANDHRDDWRKAWALFPGAVAYVWHASLHAVEVAVSLEAAGFERRSQIIWAKQQFSISRGHYHWQHEPAWYAVRKGSSADWSGDRSQTTLWAIENPNQPVGRHSPDADNVEEAVGHGTPKPVECMARPMRNHKAKGVYDPFVGSGSTLIAAERLGRTCYAMDIDPAYVDVSVARWERLTGKKAVKETA